MTPTIARRSRTGAGSPGSSSGSASTTSPARTRARKPRAARSASSRATTSTLATPTAATSASTRMRSTDTEVRRMADTVTTTETATGFDLALTEEQQLAQRTARDFAREKVLPRAHDIDEQGMVPLELIQEMAALGFMGIYVPESYGGAGLDALSYALVSEEINRACASTGVIMSSHVSLVVDPLLHYGSDAQKGRFLRPLARGEKLGCFALSAPASGRDAAAMRTSARRGGESFVLNGTKNFITNGSVADVAIVFAQTDPSLKHKGIAAFVVEKGTPGFSVGKLERKLGIRGSDTAQLIFQECRVPAANLLGSVGDGFKIALATLDGGRISIAAQAVGIARACPEDALAYAEEGEGFGKKLTDFQEIQWKLADMATEIDAARLLTWKAASLKDQGAPHVLEAAEAKLFASDVAMKAARECVQIFGGYGYLADYPAERHYRDAKITEI